VGEGDEMHADGSRIRNQIPLDLAQSRLLAQQHSSRQDEVAGDTGQSQLNIWRACVIRAAKKALFQSGNVTRLNWI
jgi:hypothetical protein